MKEELLTHLGKLYPNKKAKKLQKKCRKEFHKAASIFFLRMFSPAIISPHEYGIYKQKPSKELQRFLVLVSKVMQNLSNGVFFQEEYMEHMNTFITKNLDTIQQYFDDLPVCDQPIVFIFYLNLKFLRRRGMGKRLAVGNRHRVIWRVHQLVPII